MSTKPSWKDCEDCCNAEKPYPHEKMEKLAKAQGLSTGSAYRELVGTVNLQTLCEKCILITPCSVCNKILSDIEDDSSDEEEEEEDDDASITMEISNFDQEPICSKCIKKQCSDCGEDGGFIKTWYGSIICEECSMRLCNECGGGECTKRCPICDRSCDYGCAATLCEDCGNCDQYSCNCSKKEEEEEEEEEEEDKKEEIKPADEEEPARCKTCDSKLLRLRVYSSLCNAWRCSNACVKCDGCYNFCECSKKRWKECKFCEEQIPVGDKICGTCCKRCKGGCNYECKECKNNCDTECECKIKCGFCDNKIRHYDFVHDEEYQCNTSGGAGGMGPTSSSEPMCPDCASTWCWNCEGPCAELCEDCGACDQCNCSKKEDEEEEEEEDDEDDEEEEEEEKEEEEEEKQQSQSFLQYLHKCLMIIGVFLINTINTLKLILLSYSNNLYQNGRRLYLLLLKSINAWYSENRHDRKDA